MEKKSYINITEMAKLREVTTETLRYYDRIGLLKPDFLDKNNVRYYSVLKYEQLETIKELQQMGMGLKDIEHYLTDRNIDTSYELLLRQQLYCKEQLKLYQALEEKISRKIDLISSVKECEKNFEKPQIKHMEKIVCLRAKETVWDEVSLGYACMELEQRMKNEEPLLPIYASDRYAGQFSLQSDCIEKTTLLLMVNLDYETANDKEQFMVLPAGDYLSIYSDKSFWDRTRIKECFNEYAGENQLRLSENAICISKIDYSITDIPEERLYEFLVRCEK